MRLFIAVNFPEHIKDSLEIVQRDLKKIPADVKWIPSENLHITLKFLGEVSEGKIDLINAVMAESIKGTASFDVSVKGLCVLPGPERPRVICAGSKAAAGEEKVKAIFSKIEEELILLDFPAEGREFFSHITIGRVRSKKNISLLREQIAANEKKEFGSFKLRNIDLMQSILLPEGPQYKCLSSVSI
jgi:2'-5' RNA ligase